MINFETYLETENGNVLLAFPAEEMKEINGKDQFVIKFIRGMAQFKDDEELVEKFFIDREALNLLINIMSSPTGSVFPLLSKEMMERKSPDA